MTLRVLEPVCSIENYFYRLHIDDSETMPVSGRLLAMPLVSVPKNCLCFHLRLFLQLRMLK